MSEPSPFRRWYLAFAVAVPVVVVWSYLEFDAARAGSFAAAEQTVDCERMCQEIVGLRRQAPAAKPSAPTTVDLAQRLETLLRSAPALGVQLVRIDPQPPKRAADSAYAERLTHLELQKMTLGQLVLLCETLREFDPRGRISRLRLQSPSREAAPQEVETWGVELTLTAWEHTPIERSGGGNSRPNAGSAASPPRAAQP